MVEPEDVIEATGARVPVGEQKRLSLRENFSWTFVGNVVYAGCQWGMLVVLAKIGSPVMVGQFALGLAVCAPVIMFTQLHLRAVQATDAKREYLFGDYMGLRLITTLFALFIIAGITFWAGYRRETALVILVVGLAKTFESVSDVFYGLLQQRERMDRLAKSMMIKGPLSLAALAIGVYLTGSVLWGVAGLAAAWALILVGYDVRSGALILRGSLKHSSPLAGQGNPCTPSPLEGEGKGEGELIPHWNISTLVRLAWLALPLGFVMMLISLNTNIPRYFIERYLGERELGIFAAMAYLMVAGNTVVGALGQSASPRLATYYAAQNAGAFRKLLLKLVGIGALLGGAGIVVSLAAGKEILTLLYRAEYAMNLDVFIVLMAAAGIGYVASFFGYAMTAARNFRIQMPLFAVVTITSAVACSVLVPGNGLRGAAMALLLAILVQTGGSLGIVHHALRKLKGDTNDQLEGNQGRTKLEN